MVLAHNIEQSNNYLIPLKNTTGPKWFLVRAIEKGLKLYKEEKIKGLSARNEYLMKCQIKRNYACYGFLMLCLIWTKYASECLMMDEI